MKSRAARILAAAWLAAGCRSIPAPPRAPAYLIDPRTGLEGPFGPAIGRGWEKVLAREWEEALRIFSAERGEAASVGRIQALLGLGRLSDAGTACAAAFGRGVETSPLLAACAEGAARREEWPQAYDLFEAAVLRVPGSDGLVERRNAAADKAVRAWVDQARAEMKDHPGEAQMDAEHALEIAPGDREALIVAGRAAAKSGDSPAAFARLQAAWKLEPSDAAVGEEAGNLAERLGRGDAAFEIFSVLARTDPKFRARAEESQEDFVISNWPASEREIAHAARLTRAGAVILLWRLLPQIRSLPATARAPIASDILSRKDQRILTRALQLGLITVDPATHRARPDAFLSRGEAVRILLRAGGLTASRSAADCSPPGSHGAEALAAAARCGLLPAGRGPGVGAREFRRSIAFLQGGHGPEKKNR